MRPPRESDHVKLGNATFYCIWFKHRLWNPKCLVSDFPSNHSWTWPWSWWTRCSQGGSAYNRSHSNTYRGKIIFLFGAEKSSGFSHPSGVLVHVLWRLGFFECRAILFKKSRAYFELLLIHYSAWHKEVYLHVVLKIETNLSVLNNLDTYSKYRISTVWK